MLTRIKLYETGDLEKVAKAGSKSFGTRDMWVDKMLSSFASVVGRRPAVYRSFGPFWWPLKALMVSAGEFDGEMPDPDLVAQVTTGDAALDVAAAWSHHERYSSQLLAGNTFTVDAENGDTIEYSLCDDDMEGMTCR